MFETRGSILWAAGRLDAGLKVRTMTLPDLFLDQDKPDRMYAQAGLHAAGIAAKAMAVLGIAESDAVARLASGAGNR